DPLFTDPFALFHAITKGFQNAVQLLFLHGISLSVYNSIIFLLLCIFTFINGAFRPPYLYSCCRIEYLGRILQEFLIQLITRLSISANCFMLGGARYV